MLVNLYGPRDNFNPESSHVIPALIKKAIDAKESGKDYIEVWGDGRQTRSFLYIDECLEGVLRLVRSDWTGPVNIGSEEMVSIDQLANMIMEVAGVKLKIKHIPGPQGVRGRNSDNKLIFEKLGWKPTKPLKEGLRETYKWIEEQARIAIKNNIL